MIEFYQLKLIEEVKKRPGLWNQERPTDRDEKLTLWKEVGATLFIDWKQCSKATTYDRVLQMQKKWRSLRDAYRRELRARTSGVRVNKCIYRYFRDLSFLGGNFNPEEIFSGTIRKEKLETNDITDNNDSGDYNDDDDHLEMEALENFETYEAEEAEPDPLVSSTPTKTQTNAVTVHKRTKAKKERVQLLRDDADFDESREELEIYSSDASERESEMDSDKLFLMSFLPEMKQLPGYIKMWVRAQIANTMQEAVSCHYNNTTPKGMAAVKRRRHDSSE